jgi:hypothetical protein
MTNVDLVVEGAAKAAEGVTEVVVEKATPKFMQKVMALPVVGKVAVAVGGVALVAGAGYGIVKGVKFLKNKFFKKPEAVAEAEPEAEQTTETTEESK